MNRSIGRGYTLIEALVSLSIVAVLAAIAIPSFADHIGRQRVAVATNGLNTAFRYARSEAITRATRVAVVPAEAADWRNGWVVFIDTNDNGALDTGETTLQHFAAAGQGVTIAGVGSDLDKVVSYNQDGFARRPGGNGLALGRMVLTYNGANPRALCFSIARVRLVHATTCS